MTRAEQLKAWAKERVGCPYIYGSTGSKCTPSERRARIAQYPSQEANIKKVCLVLTGRSANCSGCKYKGKCSYDCAQLTRKGAESVGLSLCSGSNSQAKKTNWEQFGGIADMPRDKVCFLYHLKNGTYNHTGIYMGDGTVIDARGSSYGVMESDLASYGWTHYGRLPGMDDEVGSTADTSEPEDSSTPTLRKGDAGEKVVELQSELMTLGYGLPNYGADGKFGNETRAALMAFQEATGLYADGVCGALTWANILEAIADLEDEEQTPDTGFFTVVIPNVDSETMTALLKQFTGSYVQDTRETA